MRAPRHTALTLLCVLAGGCSRGPALVPVGGRVTFQGRPVVPGSIYFLPDKSKGNDGLMASGLLQEDGSFKLRTYPHGNGAMTGWYKVTLSLGGGTTPGLARYTREESTTLFVEVPAGGKEDLDFALR